MLSIETGAERGGGHGGVQTGLIRGPTVQTGNSGTWVEPSWPNVRGRRIWHTTPVP
jgi:hypothetical protein